MKLERILLLKLLFSLERAHFSLVEALLQDISLVLQLCFDQAHCVFFVLSQIDEVGFMANFADNYAFLPQSF